MAPLVIFGALGAFDAARAYHQHTVMEDAARAGAILAMDSGTRNQTCDQDCATDAVQRHMLQIGAQSGLASGNIQLSDFSCGDGGNLAWHWWLTAWQRGQPFAICINQAFQPYGPWFRSGDGFTISTKLSGTRYP